MEVTVVWLASNPKLAMMADVTGSMETVPHAMTRQKHQSAEMQNALRVPGG